MQSLKDKTIRGLFWSFLDSFGVYFVKVGFTIIIARILNPEDYGLIGYTLIFTGIGHTITNGGFGMALVQKKDANDVDYSSVFFLNIFIALFIYLIFFISADYIETFFQAPGLAKLLRVTSLVIIVSSSMVIQNAKLTKAMNFKIMMKINLISTFFSGTTGLTLALYGYGVWALVFQTLIGQLISSSLLWIKNGWLPLLKFDINSIKKLFNYGSKIFLQGLSNTIFNNIYFPVIGKYFSTVQLGYFTRANQFSQIFVKQSTISFGKVLFPAFSNIRDNKVVFKLNYEKAFILITFLYVPIISVLILTAEPFVLILLTSKWLPSVVYIQLLYIEGFFFPLYMLNQNALSALGLSGAALINELLKKFLTVVLLILTIPLGIKYMIMGYLLSSLIALFFSTYVIKQKIEFPLKRIISTTINTFIITLIVAIPITVLFYFYNQSLWSNLILSPFLVVIPYYFISKIFKTASYKLFILSFGDYFPSKLKTIL